MNINDLSVKKRIMFIKEEDYYFLTYHIFIILDWFNCYSKENLFVDCRKLPYLIYFLSSDINTEIYQKVFGYNNKEFTILDYEQLLKIYTKSKFINSQTTRLLFSLNQNGLIEMLKDNRFGSISLYIKDKERVKEILKSDLFASESVRIKLIKESYSRVRSIKFATFNEKVFKNNGVGRWDD